MLPSENQPSAAASRAGIWAQQAREVTWRLIVTTVSSCLRYRVTGLAAEAAFFAILSLPPLIFGLAGSIGYIVKQVDSGEVVVRAYASGENPPTSAQTMPAE